MFESEGVIDTVSLLLIVLAIAVFGLKIIENEEEQRKLCAKELYQELMILEKMPDYKMITEIARTQNFECTEYLDFLKDIKKSQHVKETYQCSKSF